MCKQDREDLSRDGPVDERRTCAHLLRRAGAQGGAGEWTGGEVEE